jgi:signal transduction histidine kinase
MRLIVDAHPRNRAVPRHYAQLTRRPARIARPRVLSGILADASQKDYLIVRWLLDVRASDGLTTMERPDRYSGEHKLCVLAKELEHPGPFTRAYTVVEADDLLVEETHSGSALGPGCMSMVAACLPESTARSYDADDFAHQTGLVLKNVGLTADLQARLIDLRASRQRLVAAQDDERRKLERNLHDGFQQYLVAIEVKLGLVETLLTKDPTKATTTLRQLKGDADEALETLRDLARGIYPPLLADKGLLIALQTRKATLPIAVEADGIGRYPQDTEAALYFCVLEALQNIQKYAQATSATVRLREGGVQLCVEVADNGRGFDVSTAIRGNGLTNIEDRLDALGGELQIESSRGEGTTLRATAPVFHPMVAAT